MQGKNDMLVFSKFEKNLNLNKASKNEYSKTIFLIYKCYLFSWFPAVQNIFYQANKHRLVPRISESDRIEHFYNCAAALMTEQLQSLVLASIADFTDLLVQSPVSFCCTEFRYNPKR